MFICIHDLFWMESFCLKFAFPIWFHFQCILTTENLQLSSQLKSFSYPVISTMLLFNTSGHTKSILYTCYFIYFSLIFLYQFFFHIWTLVLRRNGRKQKFTNQNRELGTLCNGFVELSSCVSFQLRFTLQLWWR